MTTDSGDRWLLPAAALAVLAVVAYVYWPVTHGGFYWDDNSSLHDEGWLRGDAWKTAIFHGFNDWVNYFRPLVLALFALQLHVFDGAPEPMHVVTLGLHLTNTLLVGLLARWVAKCCAQPIDPRMALVAGALFYGLHPALIEPVFWIGCQFEQTATLFMLLGLLLNAQVKNGRMRAFLVGACFFLAACAKEAAFSFPVLLMLFDLACANQPDWRSRLRATWQQQRSVYAAVLCAGIAYLALRYWALGYFVLPTGTAAFSLVRAQKICLVYLSYWKLIVWPMASIGPIHQYDPQQFALFHARSLGIDLAAFVILLGGAYAFWRRSASGWLVLAVTAALLPVIQILPVSFNEQSLYQDRYSMTAIAMAVAIFPAVLSPLLTPAGIRIGYVAAALLAVVWLGFAIINIRVTVQLWADKDQLALWQWAVRTNPDSVTAKERLLAAYIGRNDSERALPLADALVAGAQDCPVCMLNAAYLAITNRDPERAARALDRLKNTDLLAYNRRALHEYIFLSAQTLELRNDTAGAEAAYRDSITLDAFDPRPPMMLALLLAKEGKLDEARATADAALALFAPDERVARRREFEQAVAAAGDRKPQ